MSDSETRSRYASLVPRWLLDQRVPGLDTPALVPRSATRPTRRGDEGEVTRRGRKWQDECRWWGGEWTAMLTALRNYATPPSSLAGRLSLQSLIFSSGEGTFLAGSAVFFTLV